ncbi:MAG: hypothetical protein WED01_11980, partial [Candidatus Rokuibacteriota bacterium]
MTEVPLRFEEAEGGHRAAIRVLERIRWLHGYAADTIRSEDLHAATMMFPALIDAHLNGRRLRNALNLTYRGCLTGDWQVAVICFASAAECLLSYSKGPGQSHRLAKAFAGVLAGSESSVLELRKKFAELYSLRSLIVHGRAYDRKSLAANIEALAGFANTLRHLWRTILESPTLPSILDADDAQREKFF